MHSQSILRSSFSLTSQQNRILIIGDVHACLEELEELLIVLKPKREDQLIFLGDLIHKGPNSLAVLRRAKELKAKILFGNHEDRLISYKRTNDSKYLKAEDFEIVRQLRESDWDYLLSAKKTIYLPDYDTLLVHGGFLPDVPWDEQAGADVARNRFIKPGIKGFERTSDSSCPHWSEFWNQTPFVVYGHTAYEEIQKREWTLGIDTSCVYGGNLTAYVLPEKKIYQVKAQRAYA